MEELEEKDKRVCVWEGNAKKGKERTEDEGREDGRRERRVERKNSPIEHLLLLLCPDALVLEQEVEEGGLVG